MTYSQLIEKADDLQGVNSQAVKFLIRQKFESAILEAMQENPGGDFVKVYLGSDIPELDYLPVPTSSDALKQLVKRVGNNLWSVSIGDCEWQVNELTGVVTATNYEATMLFEEITLETYCNSTHGYCIDYPCGWDVLEVVEEAVTIALVSEDGIMESAIFVFNLPSLLSEELVGHAEQRISDFNVDSL